MKYLAPGLQGTICLIYFDKHSCTNKLEPCLLCVSNKHAWLKGDYLEYMHVLSFLDKHALK